jgi:hypothetical protein
MSNIVLTLDGNNTVTNVSDTSPVSRLNKVDMKQFTDYLNNDGVVKFTLDMKLVKDYAMRYAKLFADDMKVQETILSTLNTMVTTGTPMVGVSGLLFADTNNNMIIPKIYLSEKRKEYLNFIKTKKILQEVPMILEVMDAFLEGISKGNNPMIRVANMIGLVVRLAVFSGVVALAIGIMKQSNKMPDMAKISKELILELAMMIPDDKCLFDNDSNMVKFEPNPCKKEVAEPTAEPEPAGEVEEFTNICGGTFNMSIIGYILLGVLFYFLLKNSKK